MTEGSAPKARSIDFLTPEQLKRKREVDRKSQRQARERTRAYINELEDKVREFETRVQGLEQEFSAFASRCQCRHKDTLSASPLATSAPAITEVVVGRERNAQGLPTPIENGSPLPNVEGGHGDDRSCCVDQAQWNSFANGLGVY